MVRWIIVDEKSRVSGVVFPGHNEVVKQVIGVSKAEAVLSNIGNGPEKHIAEYERDEPDPNFAVQDDSLLLVWEEVDRESSGTMQVIVDDVPRVEDTRAVVFIVRKNRSENHKRKSTAVNGGPTVLSLIKEFFWRRGLSEVGQSSVPFALPENIWVLIVDQKLLTYFSFSEKLEEMENVFKSRSGMQILDSFASVKTRKKAYPRCIELVEYSRLHKDEDSKGHGGSS
ncbi:unnamed protein product [Agarophyton chilense]